mmetsp:Transcript_14999/g.32471  ORF Transcript_14999/g.32471 Transcript_14999/m.32471 type:complete len:200 (-) Transcript_14999:872-1471(-)
MFAMNVSLDNTVHAMSLHRAINVLTPCPSPVMLRSVVPAETKNISSRSSSSPPFQVKVEPSNVLVLLSDGSLASSFRMSFPAPPSTVTFPDPSANNSIRSFPSETSMSVLPPPAPLTVISSLPVPVVMSSVPPALRTYTTSSPPSLNSTTTEPDVCSMSTKCGPSPHERETSPLFVSITVTLFSAPPSVKMSTSPETVC